MSVNIRNLKKAHYALIARYIDILNQVSKLPFFVPIHHYEVRWANPERRTITARLMNAYLKYFILRLLKYFTLGYMVRLLTESHIKGKLNELSVAYSYLAQQNPRDKSLVSWLKDTSEDCDKLAVTLTSWQSIRGLVGVLWPVALGIATTRLDVPSSYAILTKVHIEASNLTRVGGLIYLLAYLLCFVGLPFEKKRELFMPGFDLGEKPIDPSAKIENTTYYLEDQVFNLVGRGKVREIPLDIVVIVLAYLCVAGSAMIITISPAVLPGILKILLGLLWFGALLWAMVLQIRRLRRRRWT